MTPPQIIVATVVVTVAGIALTFCGQARAQGQAICLPTETLMRFLQERHGEVPTFTAKENRGTSVIVAVNEKTGTWTIFAMGGVNACLLATGEEWSDVEPEEPEPVVPQMWKFRDDYSPRGMRYLLPARFE